MNLTEKLNHIVDLGADWVLWLLAALSLIGVAVVIERALFFLTTREDLDELRGTVLASLGKGEMIQARNLLEESPSLEAHIVAAGIVAAGIDGADASSATECMSSEALRVRVEMERNLTFLGTVGNNAPLVGLLGTVIGVMGAFQELSLSTGQVTEGLMSEVGVALVTTAVGIVVAVPAVAAFNMFQRIVRARLARADALGKDVVARLRQLDRARQGA